ncbi:SRPBCC family protein [Solicola gregarius]|uniref:SRPBCC family protein n=1 Tax=Solicola gregarius TaxID=2908642 RepID=A0AA46YJF6_9ACTN|nr:SRPBCC family protein [Solicola gregarius]UYM04287.1 SRPBCC family protein [Solicola gregarius]
MTETISDVLELSTDIDAPVDRVWPIVSNLKRMGEWSPQCRKMVVFGEVRQGARTLNLNRKGMLVWPTSAKVVALAPKERIAFRVSENKTVWSYTVESTESGTRVTERREAPNGTTGFSQLFVRLFLGGNAGLEKDLIRGMETTLARIKTEAERG